MTAIGRALMSRPKMILLDEPSMGLAPQLVEEIFGIVERLNKDEGVTFLLAEQNTNIALRYANHGYILENGRVVLDGSATELRENTDVKEFYLGISEGERINFRDVKHYRRRKRWLNLMARHPDFLSQSLRQKNAPAFSAYIPGNKRQRSNLFYNLEIYLI